MGREGAAALGPDEAVAVAGGAVGTDQWQRRIGK